MKSKEPKPRSRKKAYSPPRVLVKETMTVQCSICAGATFKGGDGCTMFSS